MKNRKRGFSLVELLIVLAVIAALIATITPVALNAIRKSKATQVAQNLKTLASSIENKAYVDGKVDDNLDATIDENELKQFVRDLDPKLYSAVYTHSNGTYTVTAKYSGTDVDMGLVKEMLPNVGTSTNALYYTITFTLY